MTGKPPFEEESHHDTYMRIKRVDLHFASHMSHELCDLLSRLLVKTQSERMALMEVLEHPWIRLNS